MLRISFCGALLALAVAASPALAQNGKIHMMTAPLEVYGSRDIENGFYSRGISRSLEVIDSRSAARRNAAYTNLCIGYAKTGAFATALDYCEKAVSEGLDMDIALTNRGAVHYLLGNYTKSIADAKSALKADRNSREARRNLTRAEQSYAALQDNQNLAQDTAR